MSGSAATGLSASRAVLDNGVVVLAKSSPVTPAVTVHATFEAGAVYDPPAAAGLAHFVSRVLDRGTRSRTADDLADALEGRGVSLTIGVSRHALQLIATCLAEDLEDVLLVLAEMARHPAFPEDEVRTKRGEIVTTIRQDDDSPGSVAGETLQGMLYGRDHAYGRRVRGTVESVEGIERRQLVDFHAARVRPSALSLVVVGDAEPSRVFDAATRALDDWSASPVDRPVLPDPPPHADRVIQVVPMMNKAQTEIAYGCSAIRRSDPAYYAYWLMNVVLGQYSLGGRLGDSIRERQGMAYHVFSGLEAGVINGAVVVRAGVAAENVERAVVSIDAELAALAADGPTEQEVDESRRYLIGSMPRNLETNLGIAGFLQNVEFFGLGLDYDVRLPSLLGAVTREQVHEAARLTLDPLRAAVAIAGPYAGGVS